MPSRASAESGNADTPNTMADDGRFVPARMRIMPGGCLPAPMQTDSQLLRAVLTKFPQWIEVGVARLLNGSPALRAYTATLDPPLSPDEWAAKHEDALENALNVYLRAHENNEDPFVMMDRYTAARHAWYKYLSEVLKFLVPEVLGIDFDRYLARKDPLVQAVDRYPDSRRWTADILPARRVVADAYETDEFLVAQELPDEGEARNEQRIARATKAAIVSMFFDMSGASDDTYEKHIAFLLVRTLDKLDDHFYNALTEANIALMLQPPRVRIAHRFSPAKFAVVKMSELLHTAVYCLSMHLMDDRVPTRNDDVMDDDQPRRVAHYFDPGRFGRVRDWTTATGVPHGQWPGGATRMEPAPRRDQPQPQGDRSTTPPPMEVDLSRPPRTERRQITRNVRNDIVPGATRRALYQNPEEPGPQ